MKWIQKGQPPDSFLAWKEQANENWQPSWDGLSKPEKPEVHTALLAEQGYICCYCNRRIGPDQERSHIEHIKSRSHYPLNTLDYDNLVASCQGENENNKPVHCGNAKADWPSPSSETLLVSPLDKECEAAFEFTAIGEIIPSSHFKRQESAAETIKRLGLDVPKLVAARNSAVEGVIEGLADYTGDEVQVLIDYYNSRDENGHYTPYCSAIVYLLRWSVDTEDEVVIDDGPAHSGPGGRAV